MFRKMIFLIAAVAVLPLAVPASAAPAEQISCVKNEVPPTNLRALVLKMLYREGTSPGFSVLQDAKRLCAARHGWSKDEEQISSFFAISSTAVELSSERLVAKGVNVASLDAMLVREYPLMKRAGGLHGLPKDVAAKELDAAGVDMSDQDSVAEAGHLFSFRYEMMRLTDAFEAGKLSK